MKNPIELVAIWGNDDAESRIKISLKQWNSLINGEEFTRSTWSYYEGQRYRVLWSIKNRVLNIYGEEGEQYLADANLTELFVHDLRTNSLKII